MNITKIMEKRYSTKAFDSSKKISDEIWKQIEDSLRLAPSSVNSQPWHFIIAETSEGKERMTLATKEKFDFNTQKILDSSHTVLFCNKLSLPETYQMHLLDKEEKDGRYPNDEMKQMMMGGRKTL